MKQFSKPLVATVVLAVALSLSSSAASAAEYWASSSSPSAVRDHAGKVLGQAYGRGYNSTTSVVDKATYRRVSGSYGVYVSSSFYFYSYNATAKGTQWNLANIHRHPATSSTSWISTTKSERLWYQASQSRVAARACTDVPFLVPGNCTGSHILTNSY